MMTLRFSVAPVDVILLIARSKRELGVNPLVSSSNWDAKVHLSSEFMTD